MNIKKIDDLKCLLETIILDCNMIEESKNNRDIDYLIKQIKKKIRFFCINSNIQLNEKILNNLF